METRAAAAIPPLTGFQIGAKVVLLEPSWYLETYHGAVVGSMGTIVRHSALNPDDDGVLVDWGDGEEVRSNWHELMRATSDFDIVTHSIATCRHCSWTSELVPTPGDAAAAADEHYTAEHALHAQARDRRKA